MKKMIPVVVAAAMLVTACAQDAAKPDTRAANLTNPVSVEPVPMVARQQNEPSLRIAPPPISATRVPRVPATYNSVHTSRPVIALTFDDGPHPELTPKLLDLLRSQGVRATFFTVGRNVQAHPEIARRIVSEGHEIASHTWNHPSLPKVGNAGLKHEITDTSDAIERVTGRRPTSFRPPYGATNERVRQYIYKDGMDVIMWSVDPLDWKRPGASVVAQRLIDGAKPGAILLSHDIHPGTIEAMPEVITRLKEKGYVFVTVSQLLALKEQAPPKAGPETTVHKTAAVSEVIKNEAVAVH